MTTQAVGSPAWIRNLRSRLDLTQSELAHRVGVTHVTVNLKILSLHVMVKMHGSSVLTTLLTKDLTHIWST